jgi:hypothetical protein
MAAANPPAFAVGAQPRVNLMPRGEINRRERGELVRRWVWIFLAAVAAVALATGAGIWMQWTAQQRLAAEESQTTALLNQMAGLADVRQAADLEAELTDFRVQAMATDLNWPTLVAQVHDVMPEGVVMAGFDLTSGAIPLGDDPSLEVGAVGTFTFASASPVEIVPLIRAARALPGVMDADGWELTSEDGDPRVYTYVLRAVADQSIYTGAFAAGAGE